MANHALTIIYPASTLDSNNRMRRAYTGLTYNIRAAVVGGLYPYTYALSGEPTGMTIDSETGEITWTNPQSNSGTITLSVTDSEDTTVQETWAITVGTSGFNFVDAVNGSDAAAGTLAAPWQTIGKVHTGSLSASITYFRAGTYTFTNTDASIQSNEVSNTAGSTIWLAYPGEAPVIDYEYPGGRSTDLGTAQWSHFRMQGPNIYIDGLTTVNTHNKAFEVIPNPTGGIYRNLTMSAHGPGVSEANACFIFNGNTGTPSTGMVIQNCTFSSWDFASAIKTYGCADLLVEDCTFHDDTDDCDAAIAVKGDHEHWEVRGCTGYNLNGAHGALGGNMATANDGEVRFNNFRSTLPIVNAGSVNAACRMNANGEAITIHLSRNTFVGNVFVNAATGSATIWQNNVIINDDSGNTVPYITFQDGTDSGTLTITTSGTPTGTQNLAGGTGDSIVDANGLLQGSYRTSYLGLMGHELTDAEVPASDDAGGHPALLFAVF